MPQGKVYVGKLPNEGVGEEDVKAHFEQYGVVSEVKTILIMAYSMACQHLIMLVLILHDSSNCKSQGHVGLANIYSPWC